MRRPTGRVTQNTPLKTRAVPAMTHALKGSPKIHTPISKVDMGPIMPVCAVRPGPMRSMAIMTSSTGKAVHATALSSDSQSTCSCTCDTSKGLSKAN